MNFIVNNLQSISVVILAIVFAAGFLNLNSSNKFWQSFSANAPAYLTSLGIFFTFVGIFIALLAFNVEDINRSIPRLLEGLQVAFLSSVAGIGGSVIYRVIRPIRQNAIEADEVSAGEILNELINLNKGSESIKDALVGEGDASLSTQMGKLRNDFRDFAEKVSEDGSKALIEALEEVMRDFNAKINEQFGDNFKQLNEAVSALLEWQKEHKQQVENLTEIFRETQKGIDLVKSNIELIENSTGKIPDQISKVENAFEATDKRMEELYTGLGSLSEMRSKAEEALPHIEKNINRMTEGLETNVNKQMESVKEIFESQANQSNQMQVKFTGVVDSLNMAADDLLKTTQKTSDQVKGIIDDFQTQQSNLSKELQDTLRSSVGDIENVLNQSVSSLDQSMQQSLQRSLDMLGNNLVRISDRFVEVYEPFAERIQRIMNKTN